MSQNILNCDRYSLKLVCIFPVTRRLLFEMASYVSPFSVFVFFLLEQEIIFFSAERNERRHNQISFRFKDRIKYVHFGFFEPGSLGFADCHLFHCTKFDLVKGLFKLFCFVCLDSGHYFFLS